MTSYAGLYRTRNTRTPQSEPMPGRGAVQVQNGAGGFVFQLDDWKRLSRFLILGSAGGTYYVQPKALTRDNAEVVLRCLASDPSRTVSEIVEISMSGRAPRNDAAVFALALCAGLGDDTASKLAYDAMPMVVRTGSALFDFNKALNGFRGWGRRRRSAFARWSNNRAPNDLAYQVLKYRQREGWTHRDILRLSHPKPAGEATNSVFQYLTKGAWEGAAPHLIDVFEQAKGVKTKKEMAALVEQERLTWEFIPTEWLSKAAVWQALLPNLPITALIRNLGRLTANGVLRPLSAEITAVVEKLTDPTILQRGRVHPLALLMARKIYGQGSGEKGALSWTPVQQITQALEDAYYLSFGNVQPSGKRILLAIDVSGSMSTNMIADSPLSCAEGAGAMAMVTARTEPSYHIVAFNKGIMPLDITARTAISDVMKQITDINRDRTDCAQAMLWAHRSKIEVDQFVVITDNETWAGSIHPTEALQQYRRSSGINAQLVVVGMTSTGFSIADPNDAGALDVVGFDTATPSLISEFAKGI